MTDNTLQRLSALDRVIGKNWSGATFRVECETCGWSNTSGDAEHTKHAGVVHVTMLEPGHVLKVVVDAPPC